MTLSDTGSPFGDRFQIQSKDARSVYAGTFRVDGSATPTAIDFDHSEGVLRGKGWKGIYALDGDTLIICDNAEAWVIAN